MSAVKAVAVPSPLQMDTVWMDGGGGEQQAHQTQNTANTAINPISLS